MADANMPSKNKLHGKAAIVTGGATALAFAAYGAPAVIIADAQDEKGPKRRRFDRPTAAPTSTATSPTRHRSKP